MALTANVQGTFKNSQGVAMANTLVRFIPLDTPKNSVTDVVSSIVVEVTTNASGQFGFVGNTPYPFVLVQGAYRVVIGSDAFTIVVPGDGGTHNIKDLSEDIGSATERLNGDSLNIQELNAILASGEGTLVNQGYSSQSSLNQRYYVLAETDGTAVLSDFEPVFESLAVNGVIGINLNPGGSAATIDANIGQFFHDYIGSYSGSYGPGAGVNNKFYYALGAADWVPGNVSAVTNYFNLPNNERYYKQVIGFGDAAISLFVLDSNPAEPDGTAIGSVQHSWFVSQIAASTTRWNVVVFRDAMALSVTGYSNPGMDWNWESYNVHAIICGGRKFYERLTYGTNLPVFVVGGMHVSATPFGATAAGSQVRYNTLPTLFMMTATPGGLFFTVVNSYGTVVDTWGVFAPLTDSLRVDINTTLPGALTTAQGALEVIRGLADSQVFPGGFNNYKASQEGRIIPMDALPTSGDVQINPYLKNCFILVGDDPPRMWYWHKARKSWQPWGYAEQGSSPYFGSPLPKLSNVVFTPSSLNINAPVTIVHANQALATEIWYSIDGGPYVSMSTAVTDRIVVGATGRVRVVSAYASRSGYRDSEITSVEVLTP